jgi:hypothetical protein
MRKPPGATFLMKVQIGLLNWGLDTRFWPRQAGEGCLAGPLG